MAGDFTLSGNRALTIAAGQTQSAGVVTVSANDNNVDAADKAVTVSGVAANTQGVAGNPPDQTLTIRDDEETPRVALVLGTDTIGENAGSTTVKATIPHPSSHETVVTITAVAGAFTVGGTLTIPAGSTESPTATLTAVDNETDAVDRQVTVNATAANGHGILNPVGAALTITDDEETPRVALVLGAGSINENAGSTTVKATIPHPSSHETVVTITAVAGAFTVGGTLTIPAGSTESPTATLTAVDNETDAVDRQVTVNATAANGHGILNPVGSALTITDDEETPQVELVLGTDTIGENAGSTTVKATIPHPSSHETVVTITAVAGAFTVGGTLTIPAGSTESPTATLTAVDNETDAVDRQVTVNATAANGHGILNPVGAALTITDDEETPRVALVLGTDMIGENAGSTTVKATIPHPSSHETVVTITAVAGAFTVGGTLTIPAGSTESPTATLIAVDNETDAVDRQVTVNATAVNGHGILNPVGAALTITDDDETAEQPTLTVAAASAAEGGALSFAVTLSPATDQSVTVNWAASTSGGDTASATDLSGTTSGTLTFAANETSQTITVNTVQDEIHEGDETFTVTLSGPSNAVLGTEDAATGTIVNDEALPTVTLALAPASVRESDDSGTVGVSEHVSTVTASLSHPSSEVTTVTVTAAAVGPAVAGDFTLSGNRALTIAAGQMQSAGVVTVSANDNNVDAADKAVTVSGVAANTQGVAGNPPDLALTIRDDEETPQVVLVLGTGSINENAGSTTVKATIPHPSSHETVVTITPVAGAFTVGGTLTIPAGSTESPTATLTAVDNETDAADRQVTVNATAANGHGIEPGRVGADDHR